MNEQADLHEREAAFHDEWAQSTDLRSIRVRECFEAPTALENRFILDQIGDLSGKRLLDVGAGLGESSVYFALKGARVTMTDISPGMVKTANELAKLYKVEMEAFVSTGEELNVPAETYDVVYLANIIHHVHDRQTLFEQIHRALKPGGRFFSWDPVAYNPVINLYRRMATETRTADEKPLRVGDLALARHYFPDLQHREFWISTLLLFVKYFAFDRVHPNADRYWKRIFTETDATLWWWKPLRLLDSVLTRLPGIRWLSWNTVMFGTKS